MPISFIATGAVFAGLFVFFTYALISGVAAGSFLMNPIYLFELAFAALGLTVTASAAIIEWRKKCGRQEQSSAEAQKNII